MAYSCCLKVWGNLDFLPNKFYNTDFWKRTMMGLAENLKKIPKCVPPPKTGFGLKICIWVRCLQNWDRHPRNKAKVLLGLQGIGCE